MTSDLPVVLLSGQFDPIRPESLAIQAAQTLPNAMAVTQPGRGHGIWINNECVQDVVEAFVTAPGEPLDTSCIEAGVEVAWDTAG